MKCPAIGVEGVIILIDMSSRKTRLGGSALLQCYSQIGDASPDLDDPALLVKVFNVLQKLINGECGFDFVIKPL